MADSPELTVLQQYRAPRGTAPESTESSVCPKSGPKTDVVAICFEGDLSNLDIILGHLCEDAQLHL